MSTLNKMKRPTMANKATVIPPDYVPPVPDPAKIDFVPPDYKLTMSANRHMYVIPPAKIEPEAK
jgi:hypothetical protein